MANDDYVDVEFTMVGGKKIHVTNIEREFIDTVDSAFSQGKTLEVIPPGARSSDSERQVINTALVLEWKSRPHQDPQIH